MYKTTQDAKDFIARVASHATKESRRGIIKNIPAWAAEPEEYYNTLLEQFDSLATKLHETRERVIWLRQQLRNTLPFKAYEDIKKELDFAGPLLVELEQESGTLRSIVRAAASNAWGSVFYYLAEKRLDGNVFKEIDLATQELLNRNHQDLEKKVSRSEMSDVKKASLKRRERRREVRKHIKDGTYKAFVPDSQNKTWHAR